MKRKIIKIDADKCNGCRRCVDACHEGAIGMVDGKARLMRDDYCDGLGDCLPSCPTGAISFEEREAADYDEAAVRENMAKRKAEAQQGHGHEGHGQHKAGGGCPGSMARSINRDAASEQGKTDISREDKVRIANEFDPASKGPVTPLPCGCPGTHSKSIKRDSCESESQRDDCSSPAQAPASQLNQWPVQIKLVPVNAPYFAGANLLVAADCSAFAYGDFHNRFIKNHVTVIGCPKLDMVDYSEKLAEIIKHNDIKSLKVVKMEVPCCGGLEQAAKKALMASGKFIPWQVLTVTVDGKINEN